MGFCPRMQDTKRIYHSSLQIQYRTSNLQPDSCKAQTEKPSPSNLSHLEPTRRTSEMLDSTKKELERTEVTDPVHTRKSSLGNGPLNSAETGGTQSRRPTPQKLQAPVIVVIQRLPSSSRTKPFNQRVSPLCE